VSVLGFLFIRLQQSPRGLLLLGGITSTPDKAVSGFEKLPPPEIAAGVAGKQVAISELRVEKIARQIMIDFWPWRMYLSSLIVIVFSLGEIVRWE
jgi:hypothetical protein